MASILTFCSIQVFVLAANAFTLTTGFPLRTNTKRTAPPVGMFDLAAPNAGINRADCFDAAQKWQFALDEVPADATTIEIWSRADDKSCAPPAERMGGAGATSPQCYRVASFTPDEVLEVFELDNLSIVQATDKKKNVEAGAKLDAAQVCAKSEHMKPTGIYLHIMAFKGSDVLGYSTDAASNAPYETVYRTLYDLMGPNPPSGLTLGTGEGMLTAKFKAQTASDFAKHRAYCFRGAKTPVVAPDAGDAGDGGDGGDGGDAKTDAGSTTSTCPAGHPFVPGTLPTSALDDYLCAESAAPAGDLVMDKVENETPYAVVVAGVDKQGNYGVLSEVVCDTPRATNSFYDNYNAAGGTAGGGYCSIGDVGVASGGVAGLALAVVGVAFLIRRRRVAALPAVALLLSTAPSRAQETTPSETKPKPPKVAIEARLGPYRPEVDRGFNGETPYKKTFGDSMRWMVGAEVDYQAVHIPHVGSIGFGGLFGYTYAKAKADFADGNGTSDESTSFDLWVLSMLTTVRFDVLARETVVPIVPYAKAGLMWGLWNSSDGHGVSRGPDGRIAKGRTNGFFYAVGAMLLLDAIDPEAAKVFMVERGVKHSYVFGELTIADLRGYGQTNAMRVGDLTWTAGLAFEM